MGAESPFVDLRRLADWFVTSPTRPSLHVERIVQRLGATAVPLLGRELTSDDARRRDASRAALGKLATTAARTRVIAELRQIADGGHADTSKICALGLLAELGERGIARFADPSAIQRSSALALAAQLETAADVASAVDLMVRQLGHTNDGAEMVSLVAVMAEATPGPAHRIGTELCMRLDVEPELRERIAEVALVQPTPPGVATSSDSRRAPRPTLVHVLVDDASRIVVVAIRKVSGERRWRRWAVLIANDRIDDCIHEEQAGTEAEAALLVQSLLADGYRALSTELERAKDLVASAARATGAGPDGERLAPAYYLGRDLLELGDAHLARARTPTSATIGRAVELIADGEVARARLLLARCDESADVVAASAACLLAQARPADAVPLLVRACELEPAWPLHHWNLAAACHATGDAAACYQALRRFISTSALPTGLVGDPEQPARVALASRLMAELERTARLVGIRLRGRRRRKP